MGIIAMIGAVSCAAQQPAENRAIEMARKEMIHLSKNLKDHIPIDPDRIEVTESAKDETREAWWVTLVEGDCTYIIFAEPGARTDVAGMSQGCLTSPPPPTG